MEIDDMIAFDCVFSNLKFWQFDCFTDWLEYETERDCCKSLLTPSDMTRFCLLNFYGYICNNQAFELPVLTWSQNLCYSQDHELCYNCTALAV